ncbi:MAG TPA: isocitrate lyase [Bacteriovoracaceae bacterium]|nr:isocitrate lyase [Bacteriovoracaceae bacterium]
MSMNYDQRYKGIKRNYTPEEVKSLKGSYHIEYSIARMGAHKLWNLLQSEPYIKSLGALTGNQAMQQVRAGLKAIYLSGWQVAADANLSSKMYPDQSLYAVNSVPEVVRKINEALLRADQIEFLEGNVTRDWLVPIIADAEAGFGGVLNAYELMKSMIEAGAAGVHFEDQLASEKKCGHLGGKVLIPTSQFINTLNAARLASDVCGTDTILIARTDAHSASLLTSDIDEYDREFITGERTSEGLYHIRSGIEMSISRALAYAPYADVLWCETSTPDLNEAKRFAEGVHKFYPGKLLAYNCSPSFHWKKHLSGKQIAKFQTELAAMGYKFQFITLAGFHSLNYSMFKLARLYNEFGMSAYARLQNMEFREEEHGYTAVKHQREVGTTYFDKISQVITQGKSSTRAYAQSTESEQFLN